MRAPRSGTFPTVPGDVSRLRPLVNAALGEYALIGVPATPVRVFNNAVFRLEVPDGGLALRIHRKGYRTPTEIESELVYLAGLAATGTVDVPTPRATRRGGFVAEVQALGEVRHCSVVTWLPGEVRRPGTGAGPATLVRIGAALGRIHEFSASFAAPAGFGRPAWDLDTLLGANGTRLPGEGHQLIEEVRHRTRAVFGGIARSPATFGVIHHDFILLNCLHRGRRTAVIDFDDCGWGFYLQDLGGILGNLKDYPHHRSLWKQFLDGYRSVRPLPVERSEDLELVVALRHAATALWMLDRDRERPLPADQLRQNLDYRFEEIKRSLRALDS